WIDERGREHEPGRVDDPMLVRVEPLAERCDHAVIDTHVETRIDALDRIDDAGTPEDDVRPRLRLRRQHHATPAAARLRTPTGPPVSPSERTAIRTTRPDRTCASTDESAEPAARRSVS